MNYFIISRTTKSISIVIAIVFFFHSSLVSSFSFLTLSILSVSGAVDLDDIIDKHFTYDSIGYALTHNDRLPWQLYCSNTNHIVKYCHWSSSIDSSHRVIINTLVNDIHTAFYRIIIVDHTWQFFFHRQMFQDIYVMRIN